MSVGRHSTDHEIKIGSTTKGLKLIRNQDGSAMYQVIEDIPSYQNPLESVQDNWSGGHGQHTFRKRDMFFEGENIDVTQGGKIILGPRISSDDVYRFVDGAVADDGGAQTDETTEAQSIAAGDMTLLPATPAVNDAYYFGADATFQILYVNISTAGAGTWTITWEYWNGSSWAEPSIVVDSTTSFKAGTGLKNVVFSGTSGWVTTAVDGITKYWLRGRVSAYTSITTQPLGTQAWVLDNSDNFGTAPVEMVWFNATDTLFVTTATQVFEYTSSKFWERVVFSGETITHLLEFNGIMYVALDSATKYYYTSDGDTYTQTDLTNGYAEKFLNAPNPAGTAQVLWKFKQPNEVSNTTDGRTVAGGGSQWSSPAYTGDTSNNITNLFLANDNLMVGREDGLFHYDVDGGMHPLMPELQHSRSTDNFKYVVDWQGSVYFSLVTGLGEISGYNTIDVVGPLANADDIGKIADGVVGLTSDRNWVYVALDEGTNTHIYKGREAERDGRLRWEWCPFINLLTNTCAVIKLVQHSVTSRRLWFGYGNGARYVTLSDNPVAQSGYGFATAGWLRMSYTYGSNAYWDKLWQSAVIETVNPSANTTVQVKYREDTDTSATECIAAYSTAGITETNFASALNNKRVQFEIHLATIASATTPEVSHFQVKGIEKPTTVRIHEATYSIGSEPSKSAEVIRTFLRGGRTSTTLIRFADLRYGEKTSGTAGTDFVYCIMEPGYPREYEPRHSKGDKPELGITVRLREISFT